jgi:hypothetical protein
VTFATKEEPRAMMTTDGSWEITLLVGSAMLLTLGLTFMFLTRSIGTPSVSVRCPITGHMIAVQHIADEGSYLTDVVTCSAFDHGQPITCGLPCLTGGVRTRVSERLDDPLKV